MNEIKPIETEYNGYRFRSRLEARWAVFFDALGVRYEYEPEGFVLPSGRKYLPDFRVKCYGTRGELHKPKEAYAQGDLCRACRYGYYDDSYAYEGDCKNTELAREGGMVTCAKSDPDANGICVKCDGFKLDDRYPFDLYIEVKGKMTHNDADRIHEFAGDPLSADGTSNPVLVVGGIPPKGCSSDNHVLGAYEGMDGTCVLPFNYDTIDGDIFAAYPAAYRGRFFLWGDDSNYIWNIDEVEAAYDAARKARFEHGETGGRNGR